MTDKPYKITPDRLISRSRGQVKYYADDGSIVTSPAKQVQVIDPDDVDQTAPEDSRRDFNAEEDAEVAVEQAEYDSEPEDQDPAAPPARSTRSGKGRKKVSKVVTKKAAAKKGAKKAARKTSSGAVIRSVAGREHDISGYEKVKNASGHVSYDNGDTVAQTLRGKELDEVYELAAKKLKTTVKELKAKYKNLNPGMQRMSLGNRLRKVMQPKAA